MSHAKTKKRIERCKVYLRFTCGVLLGINRCIISVQDGVHPILHQKMLRMLCFICGEVESTESSPENPRHFSMPNPQANVFLEGGPAKGIGRKGVSSFVPICSETCRPLNRNPESNLASTHLKAVWFRTSEDIMNTRTQRKSGIDLLFSRKPPSITHTLGLEICSSAASPGFATIVPTNQSLCIFQLFWLLWSPSQALWLHDDLSRCIKCPCRKLGPVCWSNMARLCSIHQP